MLRNVAGWRRLSLAALLVAVFFFPLSTHTTLRGQASPRLATVLQDLSRTIPQEASLAPEAAATRRARRGASAQVGAGRDAGPSPSGRRPDRRAGVSASVRGDRRRAERPARGGRDDRDSGCGASPRAGARAAGTPRGRRVAPRRELHPAPELRRASRRIGHDRGRRDPPRGSGAREVRRRRIGREGGRALRRHQGRLPEGVHELRRGDGGPGRVGRPAGCHRRAHRRRRPHLVDRRHSRQVVPGEQRSRRAAVGLLRVRRRGRRGHGAARSRPRHRARRGVVVRERRHRRRLQSGRQLPRRLERRRHRRPRVLRRGVGWHEPGLVEHGRGAEQRRATRFAPTSPRTGTRPTSTTTGPTRTRARTARA